MSRIAIDTSPISLRQGRGYRRHVITLLKALSLIAKEHEFFILKNHHASDDKIDLCLGDRFYDKTNRSYIPMLHRKYLGCIGKIFLKGIALVHFPCGDIWYSPRGKAVTTIHDLAPLHFPEKFFSSSQSEKVYWRHLQFIKKYAASVITVSQYSQKDISEKLGIPADRIHVVYNALDTAFHGAPKISLPRELSSPYFLFVGNFDFRKNIPLLLDAYRLYLENGGKSNLVLVGKQDSQAPVFYPPFEEKLQSINKQFGQKVFLFQNTTDDLLHSIYAQANALIFPSSFEGFGLPAIEAMSLGIPVISSRSASLPEICLEGALYTDLTAEGISEKMVLIETNAELKLKLIHYGKSRASAFSLTRMGQDTLEVYRKTLCNSA